MDLGRAMASQPALYCMYRCDRRPGKVYIRKTVTDLFCRPSTISLAHLPSRMCL